MSGIFSSEKLSYTPLLVFLAYDDAVEVRLIDRPADLLILLMKRPLWVNGMVNGEVTSFNLQSENTDYNTICAPIHNCHQVDDVFFFST